jgi:hypothetical protein
MAHMIESSVVLMHADLPGTAVDLDDFPVRLRRLEVRLMPPETLLESWQLEDSSYLMKNSERRT